MEKELCTIASGVTEKFLATLGVEERTVLRAALKKLRQWPEDSP